jgi:hypothetical protein
MRVKDNVVLRHDIKESLIGGVIPEGAAGTIIYKMAGSGRNMYEVDFGKYGVVVCDKDDIEVVSKNTATP